MKRFRSQKGAALLEAAITIPLILLICIGIFEFGRAYQTWQVLTNAAREGARIAILSGTKDSDVEQRVRDYMAGGALPYARSNTTAVKINHAIALTGSDTGSQVEIDYPFQFMFLQPVARMVVKGATAGAFTMRSTAVMRNEGS